LKPVRVALQANAQRMMSVIGDVSILQEKDSGKTK